MGLKKLVLIGIFLSAFLYAVAMVNAEIIISQPSALYSLGDELSIDIKLDNFQVGYLDLNLVCSSGLSNLYHNVADSKAFSIKRKLTPTYIGNLSGTCQVVAIYGSDSKTSQTFEISNQIEIVLPTDQISIVAGENIKIKGTTYKKNNQLVGQLQNAFVQIVLNQDINITGTIKDSQFSLDFSVPETTHAGIYSMQILAYDKDEIGNVLNIGETTLRLNVAQTPARVSIALDKTQVDPMSNITIMAFIYDKSGDEMNNTVLLKIQDNTLKTIYQKIISTNQLVTFETSSNNLPGYATVIAENGNLSAEKTFQINELKKITATIKDGKIVLTNIGNVPYFGPIEIAVGGEIFTETLNLAYGENKSFDITAPDGFYDVSVSDGNPILSQNSVSLTGNVISLRESGAKIGDYVANNPIVWIFIVGIVILFLIVSYKRHYENKRLFGNMGKPDKMKILDMRKKGGIEVVNPGKVMDRIVAGGEIKKAEQMTVLHGQKQQASIISLKIKNNVDGIAQDNITKALDYGYKQKAVSYSTGNGAILIFSPLVTKTNKNEEAAVKVALDIDAFLKEHNRKFRNDKISYGIGVNSGEIVNQLNGKVLQFANINKTITIAKKVADLANDEVLLSKDMHEKTAGSIKTDKVASGAMDLFTVKRVINTEETKKFMNEFMRRNTTK